MKTVNLQPTPEGVRHMAKMFTECKQGAEQTIAHAEALQNLADSEGGIRYALGRLALRGSAQSSGLAGCDVEQLLTQALEALVERESERVRSMDAAIAECNGGAS